MPREEQARYLKPDFLKRLEPLEPVRFLPELKTRSLRIQFVDEYGESKEAVRKIETAAPHSATIRHYLTALELRTATADGGLFKWISQKLIPPKESALSTKEGSKEQ